MVAHFSMCIAETEQPSSHKDTAVASPSQYSPILTKHQTDASVHLLRCTVINPNQSWLIITSIIMERAGRSSLFRGAGSEMSFEKLPFRSRRRHIYRSSGVIQQQAHRTIDTGLAPFGLKCSAVGVTHCRSAISLSMMQVECRASRQAMHSA